ncbi:muscular LMNA-interacting protein isoform X20 [Monodelphis domestica]|uniref:muscular LMNA-interacting protein isoform X20 n=1 Tax=Monodelphis domestica TaxID=13616 RepID=UPI0024E1ED15|nr:muscular LMNA-interacting protein isoform X20 [Monodelphis domestica]
MDRGNHKKTDSVNKTLKEEKLTVFSGDSETKPLIFTFVPTIRRLPTHSQVADATKYLVKIGEEPRDKSHGAINRSNSNEFLDCVTLKSGIQQESDIQTYACSTETSPKIIQGRGLKLNQPETMQQSDLFKAEYVFIVDSEGEEEATGRKEDKQPTVGNGHGLARPKSLALAPGPITTLQKPHQGDFQGPPQSDLPQDAASPQKQIQALDEPSKSERITKDSTLDSHLEFCSPAQLRQQTEELCAAIDKVLQESLSMHSSDSPSSSMQTGLGSDGNKMPVTVPRAAGRETKYANLTSPSSTMAVSQLTKPGVIRPVPAKSKIILRKEEEETYEPNPFSKYLEDTSGLFAGQDVTSLHDATPLHPLYKTKPFPPAKSLLYPQNLSYTDCLTPGPFSHLSSVSLGDGHVNSPTSFSHNRLYNKPSHPIVTIPENEALDSKEVLQHKLRELHESGAAVQAGPLDFSLHDLNPGDKVYIKNFKRTGATQPSWEGPFQILLTTPTSIKIGERDSWIHCSHVKKASSAETD